MSEQPDTIPALTFRRGTPEDWPAIASITAHTWEHGDYITEALWRLWASDTQGYLAVAEHEGRPVATGKLTCLGPAEWWLEGLRVDPDLRERGIGRATMAHLLEWFGAHGEGFLRMSSSSINEATSRLAATFRFRHTVSYVEVEAAAQPADYRNFRLLQPQNVDMIHGYLRRSPMYRVNHFVEHYWTLYYLTRDRLAEYLTSSQVQVVGWRQADQMQGLAILFSAPPPEHEAHGNVLYLGYLDAADDTTLRAMLSALRGLAARRGCDRLVWKMPTGMGLERAAGAVGLQQTRDWELWLFERPLRV